MNKKVGIDDREIMLNKVARKSGSVGFENEHTDYFKILLPIQVSYPTS